MTHFERRHADWLSVEEARTRILKRAVPLSVMDVALAEAVGHALAVDVHATAQLPPWDNSAMDGYAALADDIRGATEDAPVTLRVTGEILAGGKPTRPVSPGEAVRIMTGAPVPPGADSVVRVEHTDAEQFPGTVVVRNAGDAGRNVRLGGEDMRPGDTVLVSGTNIGAGQVGVLSALGLSAVSVHRPAQVALLANGDELAPIDRFSEVQSGDAVPETNTHAVGAAIREIGAVPQRLGIALDTEESVEQHLNLALDSRADVLLTLAGASMGETDLVKRVLDRMGFELDFWRVQMRPGSPFSFGLLPRTDGRSPLPVFGLPGNPASAFVTFHVLVRPFLLALAGHSRMFAPVVGARAGTVLRAAPHLAQFVRVRLEGSGLTTRAFQAGPQGSGLVRGMGQADGLAVVPEDVAQIGVGEPVSVILLGSSRGWSQDAGYVASSS